MYKIEAVLKSPLMIGGKKLNNNYRDYIPGSVLRAAYARALVLQCACEQKDNWLVFQARRECRTCAFKTICEHFSQISFPALYPMGGSPYPVTARENKYTKKGETEVFDLLKSRLTERGKVQGESEWIRLEGFHKDGQKINLIHTAITRTAIDYQRNAAQAASLYTQNVVSEQYLNEKNESADVVFSGEIALSPKEEKELRQIRVLHIGADATRGFGICHMFFSGQISDDTPEQIRERIQEFNSGTDNEQLFVILDLLTDAYLGLEEIAADDVSQTKISDDEMLSFLEKKLGLDAEKYHLKRVFKFQEFYRGMDTSKNTQAQMYRPARLVVQAGAVFVYQACEKDIDEEELLQIEKCGIGQYTEHGFGKIRICDRFHVKYDVSGGK